MNRLEYIKSINRIQQPRRYNDQTLRLDMAEKGDLFDKKFYQDFKDNKLKQLDFIAYPDYERYIKLEQKILNTFKFSYKNIFIDSGSDSIIRSIIQCFCPEKSLVTVLNPSFPMYSIYANSLGVDVSKIEYNDKTHIEMDYLIKKSIKIQKYFLYLIHVALSEIFI